ncbi:MAG: DUF1643 domain-containing protein [Acutalibacteraceae bacterium]|nr:DUF1643 domain-containing protein [Acutalibacteraceae bacterium]
MFQKYIGDEKVRYVLGNTGEKTLVVFGINPSTANKDKSDTTISTILYRLNDWGYDSFVMLNIYPERATKLINLPKEINEEIHLKNLEEIEKVISDASGILCAWGNQITDKDRSFFVNVCLKSIAEKIDESNVKTYCLGTSKTEHPYHPLARVKKPEKLLNFDLNTYYKKLSEG